jgi:hypothetical protein
LVQTMGDLRPFGECQGGNRRLDFSNRAHGGNLCPSSRGVKAARWIYTWEIPGLLA